MKAFENLEKGDVVYLINLKSPFENPEELIVKEVKVDDFSPGGLDVTITFQDRYCYYLYARKNYNFCLGGDYSLFYIDDENPIVNVVKNTFEYGDSRRLEMLRAVFKDLHEE